MSKKENKIIVFYNDIEQRNKYKLNGVDVTDIIERLLETHEKEIASTKFKLFQLDMAIQQRLQYQLALTEKALELACRELDNVEVFESMFMECDSFYEYFLNKAKEMMENE